MAKRPKPYSELGAQIPMTREMLDLCYRRVGGLTEWSQVTRPLIDLLANAYVLGAIDAAETIERRGSPFTPKIERDVITIG